MFSSRSFASRFLRFSKWICDEKKRLNKPLYFGFEKLLYLSSTDRMQYGQAQSASNDDFRSSQWSPEDGRYPESNSASTQFADRYEKNIYSQSAPLQPRIVKVESRYRKFCW